MSRDYTEITDEQLRAINKRAIEQPPYEQLREQNRVLRGALEQIAMSNEVWERDQMIDCAQSALTATSQEGQG